MTSPDDLLVMLRSCDPAPSGEGPPEAAWTASACLDEIERRLATDGGDRRSATLPDGEIDGELVTFFDPWEPVEIDSPVRRAPSAWMAGAVAAAILVVVGVFVVTDGDNRVDVTESASVPETTDAVQSLNVTDPVVAGDVQYRTSFDKFVVDLHVPNDVQFDPSGGMYISETVAGRVVRVAILPDGSAGELLAVASDIRDAEGLALDDTGVLYVSGRKAVYRVADGITTQFVDGFNRPDGLAIDAKGDLYVADQADDAIRITKVSVLDGGVSGAETEIAFLRGSAADIEFGPTGELFVANRIDQVRALAISDDGSVTSRPYAAIPGGPAALAFAADGTLYVGTDPTGTVWKVEQGGERTPIAAASTHVEGLAVDPSGNLYLTNVGQGEVLTVDTGDPAASVAIVDRLGYRWSRVPHDDAVFGGAILERMSSVTAGGPGLVAVGSAANVDAAVWTSVDGLTWSRVPNHEAVFGGDHEAKPMNSVVTGGPGLVAIGSGRGWTSTDGLTWSRIPGDLFESVGPNGLTAGGPGMVAVGADEQGAAVWTSVDGLDWSRVPHDEEVFGYAVSGEGDAVFGVTSGGPGLVAVGSDGLGLSGEGGIDAAGAVVWTSVGGLMWSRVPHDESVFGGAGVQGMFDVTVGGPGMVAVGQNDDGAPVWTSVDGITWSQVPDDAAVFDRETVIFKVISTSTGLLALGDVAGCCSPESAAWTSSDGFTWALVDDAGFGVASASDVTVGGPGLVAVGANGSGGTAVWVATLEN